ncbi:MAG: site-specific integrase, partial [Desulfovibrio sp.]|nr:site-specific integrase [Desulfovibrio sp.]
MDSDKNTITALGLVWEDQLLAEKGLAKTTVVSYAQDLANFVSFLQENRSVGQVNEHDILLYLAWQKSSGQSARTIARRLSALRSFFDFARQNGLIETSPTKFCENPKLPFTLPEVLSQAEITTLLSQPKCSTLQGQRDHCMLSILYACGLRVSELCGLTLKDIDAQRGVLHIKGKG